MKQLKTATLELITNRLRLFPQDAEMLDLLLNDQVALAGKLGLEKKPIDIPWEWQEPLQNLQQQLQALNEEQADWIDWLTPWAMVHRYNHSLLGVLYFESPPNAEGRVHIRFWLDEPFRNQGLMSEALKAISTWVFSHPETQFIRAETPKDNRASQRVLQKNGYVPVEEHADRIVWERSNENLNNSLSWFTTH